MIDYSVRIPIFGNYVSHVSTPTEQIRKLACANVSSFRLTLNTSFGRIQFYNLNVSSFGVIGKSLYCEKGIK
jgi:hypothetical protein